MAAAAAHRPPARDARPPGAARGRPRRRSTLDGVAPRRRAGAADRPRLACARPAAARSRRVASACAARPASRTSRPSAASTLRFVPNDPSLTTPRPRPARRRHAAAVVGRAQRPARRLGHRARRRRHRRGHRHRRRRRPPRPRGQDRRGDRQRRDAGATAPPTGDEDGHGTHVASLACAAGDNGAGIVGAGLDCRLIVIKSDLSDGSIARSIVQAADRGAGAINMSFGTDGSAPAVARVSRGARLRGHARTSCSSPPPPTAPSRSRATPPTCCSRPAPARPHRRPRAVGHGRGLRRPARAVRRARLARSRSPPTAPSMPVDRPRRPDRRLPRQRHASSRPAAAPVPAAGVRLPHADRRRPPLRLPPGHVDGGADRRRGRGARARR